MRWRSVAVRGCVLARRIRIVGVWRVGWGGDKVFFVCEIPAGLNFEERGEVGYTTGGARGADAHCCRLGTYCIITARRLTNPLCARLAPRVALLIPSPRVSSTEIHIQLARAHATVRVMLCTSSWCARRRAAPEDGVHAPSTLSLVGEFWSCSFRVTECILTDRRRIRC